VQQLRELGKLRTPAKQAAAQNNGKLGGRPPKTQRETQRETQQETQQETQRETQHKPNEKPIERKEKENRKEIESLPPTPQGEMSESAEDFYAENMPTENAQSMLDLEKRVRSLRSGWELPLAYTEQKLLSEASRCLSELTAAQWQTMKDYLYAKIPQGVPAWQPRSRTKFLENPSDVWTHASAWRKRQEASRPPPNTIPMPVTSRPTISREELAEFFDPIKKKKMQY
jgi:hypothetical protein